MNAPPMGLTTGNNAMNEDEKINKKLAVDIILSFNIANTELNIGVVKIKRAFSTPEFEL